MARRKQKQPEVRRFGPRRLDSLLPEVGGVAFRRYGFTQVALVERWAEVAGPLYARWSLPQSIRFPRGKQQGATLTILVDGAFALQLQHAAPELLARANRILGAGTLASIRLLQGDVQEKGPVDAPPKAAPPVARPSAAAAKKLAAIADEDLRRALEQIAGQLGAGG